MSDLGVRCPELYLFSDFMQIRLKPYPNLSAPAEVVVLVCSPRLGYVM